VYEGAPNYHGIYFYQVFNGKIENVESSWNLFGLAVYNSGSESYGNTIADCYVHENWRSGVYLQQSNHTQVSKSLLTQNNNGIQIINGHNNTLTGNTANNNNRGIRLSSSSSNNEVVSNACYDNSNYDITNTGTGNFFQYNSYNTSTGV
jgi:parallel beta-helix repeat protein